MPRIAFRLYGVPENWKQTVTMSPGAAKGQHARKKRWTAWVAQNGNRARVLKDIPECTEDDLPKTVHIHQDRHTLLDPDSLPGSCAPLIDGLTRKVRRMVNKEYTYFPGARIIWDDKERWISKLIYSQKLIPKEEPQMVTIVVEIPENE